MTTLSLTTSSATALRADALVVGVTRAPGTPTQPPAPPVLGPGAEALDEAFDGRLAEVLAAVGATGTEGEITRLPAPEGVRAALVVAVGLGEAPADGGPFDAEALRRAGGATARALTGVTKAGVTLTLERADQVRAFGEGVLLGAYSFDRYRTVSAQGRKAAVKDVVLLGVASRDRAVRTAVEAAAVVATSVNQARDLVNMTPNDLTPREFAAVATGTGRDAGFEVEVWDEKTLRKQGFGGILGVGQGSVSPPRLVRLGYTHPKARTTLALVGKGITYDSGGISLKPVGHNETMKCDMGGAAAVLGAVAAVARLGLAVNVTGWLALAENMPSGSAVRPGDVLHMYGGRTVEVLNTDAEGRLVLADAITRACEENPTLLVDVATLTGAMMLALGTRMFGVMAHPESFRDAVHDAATRAGEQSWPMPLPADLRRSLDSPIADIKNTGERMGGGLVAGLFLKEFVAEGVSWAHLDVAGPAFNEGEVSGYTPKGGTGVAVRTLLQVAADAADGRL